MKILSTIYALGAVAFFVAASCNKKDEPSPEPEPPVVECTGDYSTNHLKLALVKSISEQLQGIILPHRSDWDETPEALYASNDIFCDLENGFSKHKGDFVKVPVAGTNGYRITYISKLPKPAGTPTTTYWTHEFVYVSTTETAYQYRKYSVNPNGSQLVITIGSFWFKK